MYNYKLTIQYDGTQYAGWQIQENAISIQATITETINVISKEDVNLIGAGRTDSGVHALGQVANFITDKEIDSFRFQHSLNSILPNDISIIKTEKVDESFHSRFDAKERTYLYLVSKQKSPFYFKYSIVKNNLNIYLLNRLSDVFVGENDYTSFCKKNTEVKSKLCDVKSIKWRETKSFFLFFIRADRFLHGMVRTIVGTLFSIAEKNGDENMIREIFNKKDREEAGEAVPAKGLILYNIKY
ncbi:MAG: tRNA pseudouridine(38-40) synthase TruA [Ignavibacterium sp.]|nr:MAG: tRNA pseudouridine(38-40) synthase TruA [Ignavibacterium sp.]